MFGLLLLTSSYQQQETSKQRQSCWRWNPWYLRRGDREKWLDGITEILCGYKAITTRSIPNCTAGIVSENTSAQDANGDSVFEII